MSTSPNGLVRLLSFIPWIYFWPVYPLYRMWKREMSRPLAPRPYPRPKPDRSQKATPRFRPLRALGKLAYATLKQRLTAARTKGPEGRQLEGTRPEPRREEPARHTPIRPTRKPDHGRDREVNEPLAKPSRNRSQEIRSPAEVAERKAQFQKMKDQYRATPRPDRGNRERGR